MAELFKLEISTGGSFVCTQPAEKVYLLTFSSPPDNRLTTPFLQTWLLALDILELKHPKGAVITTSGIAKFYSNGLDLEHVTETPGFMEDSLFKLFRRLLTYPMPTIALFNGHAFAGGLMVGMYHDYRVMNPAKGFLCLNEVLFGAPLLPPMSAVFRQKLRPTMYRTFVLEGKRVSAKEALENAAVDLLGGLEETLKFVDERKLQTMGDSGVYGALKEEMYRETLGLIRNFKDNADYQDALEQEKDSQAKAGQDKIDKAKL